MPDSFSYDVFHVGEDAQTAYFEYSLIRDGQTYRLTETLKFPVPLQASPAQQASLRALHLALGVSYYKIFTPLVMTHPYKMNEQEAAFWNKVWRNGLGEFLYVNKISPDNLAKFTPQVGQEFEQDGTEAADTQLALLGIGGGKDSIVAGETLKQLGVKLEGFVMATGEQRGQTQVVADAMGITLHAVERTIDRQLLALQELPGGHKGHVPISLIFGLVGATLAIARSATQVVVGNEASASIPRVEGEYGMVNHQWSKSFTFEQDLQQYIHQLITPSVTYFSAIRPLSSVAVAKLFARYPQYLELFTSDNTVFRIDPAKRPNARWSLESPKGLSSFILLAPWFAEADLIRAFGRNFLNEGSLEQLFWELLGVEGEQPLDCVGTVDELVVSLNLAAQQGKFAGTCLVQAAKDRGVIQDNDWASELGRMLKLQPESAFPSSLKQRLKELLARELA